MLVAGVSTLVFNGNPLLRYDAYYILGDLAELPNLGQRASRYWGHLIERYLLQDDPSQPEGIYRLGEHETISPACLPALTMRLDGFFGEGR